ncbi:hypothetical protein PGB34_12820 [Xenophilus arseniciresistens]|uniref:Secreted protein n=1 Tax=Xenophilus arseniciresistens TaxID=1283306 RepID=A0AAE3T058_9BURK|nr:hypothetical protein [Xenophilus arseniciresistens]MDA7417245.1 hypothetical protein [Xenophilus arseniciresistens]
MPHRPRRLRPLTVMALCAAAFVTSAHAQSDRQTYESTLERSARVCTGHSPERSTPGVRAVPVGALRVLLKHEVTLCPDRRIDAATPVVWYGDARVFAWNPEAADAPKVLAAQADAMTRKEDFPTGTRVWKADGSAAQGVTVPALELRARPAARY